MTVNKALPSYRREFDTRDFREGPPARSVYSPAAYLADLLQLVDDHFERPDLGERRPDLERVPLDAEHTFTLVPYLDIVNRLLEQQIGGEPYETLAKAAHPLNLPFDLAHERIGLYLKAFDERPEALYTLFTAEPDRDVVTRLALGLSPAAAAFVLRDHEGSTRTLLTTVRDAYGLAGDDDLERVATFLDATDLGPAQLHELLFQQLGDGEESRTTGFFVNDGLGGHVALDDGEERLVWRSAARGGEGGGGVDEGVESEAVTAGGIPARWFDRVQRLLRLARALDTGTSELDLILRRCCGNRLDGAALQCLAVVRAFAARHDRPIDVVCSLFADMNVVGFGGEAPADLFDRTFNGRFAELERTFLPGGAIRPARYAAFEPIALAGDLRHASNAPLARRLARALSLPVRELLLVETLLHERGVTPAADGVSLTTDTAAPGTDGGGTEEGASDEVDDGTSGGLLARLSLYHRVATIADVLELPVRDLFRLIDIVDGDPDVRRRSTLPMPIGPAVGPAVGDGIGDASGCAILAAGSVAERLWLVQTLFALSAWMVENRHSAEELEFLASGRHASEVVAEGARRKTIDGLSEVHRRVAPTLLAADALHSPVVDERLARAAFVALSSRVGERVSSRDGRLLLDGDAAALGTIAHEAIDSLRRIDADDLLDAVPHERVRDKLLRNLVLRGHVDVDGRIVDGALPDDAASLRLHGAFDGAAVRDVLDDLLGRSDAKGDDEAGDAESGESDDGWGDDDTPRPIPLAEDFERLGLDETEIAELLDNLAFNGHVDGTGALIRPVAWTDRGEPVRVGVDVALGGARDGVHALLAGKLAAYGAAECRLDAALFADLPLTEIERVDLLENLRFNHHTGDGDIVTDKRALMTLPADDFTLALRYYPLRHRILEAIRGRLERLKAELCTLGREELDPIARRTVANAVLADLEAGHLEDGAFTDAAAGHFADAGNASRFAPTPLLDADESATLFARVAGLVDASREHHVDAARFTGPGLHEDDAHALLETLVDAGRVRPDGSLDAGQIAFFTRVDNALTFAPEGFGDVAKDTFFVLHAVATATKARADTLVEAIGALADAQRSAVRSALAEMLEVSPDVLEVLARHVFGPDTDPVEATVPPVLDALDADGALTRLPDDPAFGASLRRLRQFATLVAKLGLDALDTDIVFRDRSLAAKYAETLTLPPGATRFDLLVSMNVDGTRFPEFAPELAVGGRLRVLVMHDKSTARCWLLDPRTRRAPGGARAFGQLVPALSGDALEAGFNDSEGNAWLVLGGRHWVQRADALDWTAHPLELGRLEHDFAAPDGIDAAFVDTDDRIYLFAGDRYLRSDDDLASVEEGYPRRLAGNWLAEQGVALPPAYAASTSAAFRSTDGALHLFREDRFIDAADPGRERATADVWGRVGNDFARGAPIDAALALDDHVLLFSGTWSIGWSGHLESAHARADEGSLRGVTDRFPDLPVGFRDGLDAIFRDDDGVVHAFRGTDTLRARLDPDAGTFAIEARSTVTEAGWGRVRNAFADTGRITAAFSGLDGRAYLFAGDQYVRYSGRSFEHVDEGYPRRVAGAWGGLDSVDAAFVLDGKTYLVGNGGAEYVRYSSDDYTRADLESPRPLGGSWWIDHFNLEGSEFTEPDAVLVGADGVTCLFEGERYIAWDRLHRWWSRPAPIAERWSGLPFESVDAAFTGKDGRAYLFSGDEHARYTDAAFDRLDERYPKSNAGTWGRVSNRLIENGRIDAALVTRADPDADDVAGEGSGGNGTGEDGIGTLTYLFAGDQYVRYGGGGFDHVDEGYPKTIAGSLADEPRLGHLGADALAGLADGIDAAWSDRHDTYFLRGDRCTVVSRTPYARRTTLPGGPVGAVVEERGVTYLQGADGWRALRGLEHAKPSLSPRESSPPMLRRVPTAWRRGIDAAFRGTDGSTYVFGNTLCYNDSLERAYPAGEEWGRVRNTVADRSRVDAAFVGTDGRTYLFGGDQYLVYSPDEGGADASPVFAGDVPPHADGHPGSIRDDRGGLDDVAVAFVRDGTTFLLEAPDEDGRFRFVRYSTADYAVPDHPPEHADLDWWDYPAAYRDDGFTGVDAVLQEDEHLYLFHRDRFIQYDAEQNLWTYPRPITRLWRDLPIDEDAVEAGVGVFRDPDGYVHFFVGEHAITYASGADRPMSTARIAERWGRVRNHLVETNRVDAALVLDERVTYLFSGDQYVRYSGDGYRHVDVGYPKSIVGGLRTEPAFEQLPERFDADMTALLGEGGRIRGVTADDRHRVVFESTRCHVVSTALVGEFPTARLGALRNELADSGRVDAACVDADGRTFLFSGDQYVRYSGDVPGDAPVHVDPGYPASIIEHFPDERSGAVLDPFTTGVDAAVRTSSGELRLFAGTHVHTGGSEAGPIPLETLLAGLRPGGPTSIDAAFVGPGGHAYYFGGGRYLRYAEVGNAFADEGYPRSIRDHWGNLPSAFEDGVDGAFLFDGRAYLTRGERYVRYEDAAMRRVSPIRARRFGDGWGAWNDYRLEDLKVIGDYKAARERTSTPERDLGGLLDVGTGYVKEPYRRLAELFGWRTEQVEWLKRHEAFLPARQGAEVHFELETILAMIAVHRASDAFGVLPEELHGAFFERAFEIGGSAGVQDATDAGVPDAAGAADSLYRWLGERGSADDWRTLSGELHDALNLARHDALLPYVIARDDGVADPRELFAKLLVDVEMGGEARTSTVKEAIGAVQLYVHRYLVNLETLGLKGADDERGRARLKRWWSWLRNYRVWEANRKVFLYPENYIRPELRDTKTDMFKRLEETLLQGEVTDALVTGAFHDYMNEFAMVGNLRITGANVHPDPERPGEQVLVLLGRTRVEPGRYYYRTARFLTSGDALWENWVAVDVTINARRVFPVYAFGRVLVFWTEIEAFEESVPFVLTTGSTSKIETADTVLRHRAAIRYSFYDFNKRWVNPQTLKDSIDLDYRIDAAFVDGASLVAFSGEYCLRTTVDNPQGYVGTIAESFPRLPDVFHTGIDAAMRVDGERWFFKGDSYVAYPDGEDDARGVVHARTIRSAFAAQVPGEGDDDFVHTLQLIAWHRYRASRTATPSGYQSGVSAAFVIAPPTGAGTGGATGPSTVCLIDKQGLPTFFDRRPARRTNASEGRPILRIARLPESAFVESLVPADQVVRDENGALRDPHTLVFAILRILTRDFLRLETVDAVFEDEDGVLYVLRKGQYECYRHDPGSLSLLEKLDGFPKPIKGNLSFNMDQFFDKLHVVRHVEGSDELVDLTFRSPEANTALVTGTIRADFTFHEGDLRIDAGKHRLLSGRVAEPVPTVLGGADLLEARREFDESAGVLEGIVARARDAADYADGRALLEDALETVNALAGRQNIPAERRKGPAGNSRRAVTEKLESSIALLDGVDATLHGGAIALRDAFDTFADSDTAQTDATTFAALEKAVGRAKSGVRSHPFAATFEAFPDRLAVASGDLDTRARGFDTLVERHGTNHANVRGWLAGARRDDALFDDALRTSFDRLDTALVDYGEALETARNLVGADDPSNDVPGDAPRDSVVRLVRRDERFRDRVSALDVLESEADTVRTLAGEGQRGAIQALLTARERVYGKNDLFPDFFGIRSRTNFTFGEPDWHVFEAGGGTFLCRPLSDSTEPAYAISRLTTTAIPALSRRLFAAGIDGLLSPLAQAEDELPRFAENAEAVPEGRDADVIRYDGARIASVPVWERLDFAGANAAYYWEIFFHAPFLIAQTLNGSQKFEAAKRWYEFVFDPTAPPEAAAGDATAGHWRFSEFARAHRDGDDAPQRLNGTIDITDLGAELAVHLDDPFDPHAIARIRQIAYRKAIVMRYVDNLLDWGDLLFRQYTAESINEARMLYVLAHDLLGERPVSLGRRRIPGTRTYAGLTNPSDTTDLLLEVSSPDDEGTVANVSEGVPADESPGAIAVLAGAGDNVHRSVDSAYFHIPENELFLAYWDRVDDRLFKIRNSLDLDGTRRTLALFQPPIDPMSIVRSVAAGGSVASFAGGAAVPVPHFRFSFMLYKSREIVQKLNQFGNELLGALEKRDAEQLALMQHRQEGTLLGLMGAIKEAQIAEARENIVSLEASLRMVEANEAYNRATVDTDFLPAEIAQLALMYTGVASQFASAIMRTVASIGGATPDALVGPFIMGIKVGGTQAHASFGSAAEVMQTVGEGLSMMGEGLGIVGQHQRLMDDTRHQVDVAVHEKAQIRAQIAGAEQQLKTAEHELDIHRRELEQHASIRTFMTSKFGNEQLYLWLGGQLSSLYYRSYRMGHDLAKGAEAAFRFERGLAERDVDFIGGAYWNSQRKGLLAGDSLGVDIDRMEAAFLASDRRRLEIVRSASLVAIDPMAFLQLKRVGWCTFALSEAFFDHDFRSHYCRQIKTLELEFDAAEGQTVHATLTQLGSHVVMAPDPKAVKYLLDPKDTPPTTIRSDWRASQQIVLSHVDRYEKGNGLFETRLDDDRYLPFEGTGAVSTWRLELNGRRGSVTLEELLDATLVIKYTALQGGERFGEAVRGLLKPHDTVKLIDLAFDFHADWLDFLADDEETLTLELTRDRFPNMAGGRIGGLFSVFETTDDAELSIVLNGDEELVLRDGQFTETAGLSIAASGSRWTLRVRGDKRALRTVQLVVGYKARV